MDPRVEEHAETLVDHSTDIGEGEMVLINSPPVAGELEIALFKKVGERGGIPMAVGASRRAMREFLSGIELDALAEPDHKLAAAKAADVLITVMGGYNVSELSDLDDEAMQGYAKVNEPLSEEVVGDDLRWVGTQHPSPGSAQRAEMSTEAYREFVYNAINRDWEAQRAYQEKLVDLLDTAAVVRIVSGSDTDVTMSIEGNPAVNDDGETNLPGGEVFTAPQPDSVDGTVRFDHPVLVFGQEVTEAALEFEDGEVVDHSAAKNVHALTSVLETDEGSARLGELGVGMNRDIDRFTYNMLFDEKMGDTVHLALGKAYPDTVGANNERNESAQHLDMIVDMSEESSIEVDGEVIQENGTFVFEE